MADFVHARDDATLARACAALPPDAPLAVDTEFMRERTYRPALGLVQIAAEGAPPIIVDPLTVRDFAPLCARLAAPGVKIMHDPGQDYEALAPVCAALAAPVFDTQLAAAFLGHGHQIGYQELVKRLLDLELDKSMTRSNWLRRPLRTAQLEYAAEDVLHLPELHRRLRETLADAGKLAWFDDESAARAKRAAGEPPAPRAPHMRTPEENARMRALVAWRERRAARDDLPRQWVVADACLKDLVANPPADIAALRARISAIGRRARVSANELLAELRRPLPADATARAAPTPPGSRRERDAVIKELQQGVREVAERLAISPELLANRRQLAGFAANPERRFEGWRATLLNPLLERPR